MKYGFDFGLRPTVMCLGDLECPRLMHEGQTCGMGYGLLPEFGLLHEPAFAAVIFANPDKGTECLKRLKGWADASGDSDAVTLSFIEPEQGGYVVCVYPEPNLLIDRCIPKHLQDETTPVLSFPIMFPTAVAQVSGKYEWFKEWATSKPFVFGAARKDATLLLDTLFVKRRTAFYDERSVPAGSPESTYFYRGRASGAPGEFKPVPYVDSASIISSRRHRRIRTLLPVVLAKLESQPAFRAVGEELAAKGYVGWQVLQAACNIVVSMRMYNGLHYEGAGDNPPQVHILDYLLTTYDEPTSPMPPAEIFAAGQLEEQIRRDAKELLRSSGADPAELQTSDLQGLLRHRGLLSHDDGPHTNT